MTCEMDLSECRKTIDLILSIKQMASEGNLQRVAASGGYSARRELMCG